MTNNVQKVAIDGIHQILASLSKADGDAVMKEIGITGQQQTLRQLETIQAASAELTKLGFSAVSGRISIRDIDARLEEKWPLHGVDTHMRSMHATKRIATKTLLRRAGLL